MSSKHYADRMKEEWADTDRGRDHPMTAPAPSDIDGPAGEAGDLIGQAMAPIYDILTDPGEELQAYIECDLERMEWKRKAEEAAACLAALQQERDEARKDVKNAEESRDWWRENCKLENAAGQALEALASSLQRRVEELTGAFEEARTEIVLAIAFLGRDAGTDRLPATITGLIERLAKADVAARAALPAKGEG